MRGDICSIIVARESKKIINIKLGRATGDVITQSINGFEDGADMKDAKGAN